MRFEQGLVIGKFYPPHAGHQHLIDQAYSLCDHVTILVCDGVTDLIPPSLRAQWLRSMYPAARVEVINDGGLGDGDSPGWATHVRNFLGRAPDAVFSSEAYGVPFSEALGCKHVMVDAARTTVPISGTEIRQRPYDHWEYLSPVVRAYFTQRIAFVGAESTGKSTIAEHMAEQYQTLWVPEYGREYTHLKMAGHSSMDEVVWGTDDFVAIAKEQREQEDRAAEAANRVLFCDTDAFATAIWHERYMGFPDPATVSVDRPSRIALYFLTDVKTPFVQDGIRDGEAVREWMDQRFEEAMQEEGRRFVRLAGAMEQRATIVRDYVSALLSQPFDYARANARSQ